MRGGSLSILIAVVVLRAATLVHPVFNQDECYIAVQAQVIVDGGVLYRDTVDRKPPLVPHIYAAVFAVAGDGNLIAVHMLAMLWVAATALVLGAIMRRRAGPREGRWASWLFVLASMALLPRDALAANFELWMLLPLCLAMLAGGRGSAFGDLAAGALLAVAVFMKQPALVTVVPLGFAIWRAPNRAIGLACLATGFGTVCAIIVATHDPRMLQWGFLSTGGYLATGDLGYAARLALIWTGSFAIASGALWWLVARSAMRHGVRGELDLWLWLATAFVGVAAGLRFFGHYHLQLVPPACLLAARVGPVLGDRVRRCVVAGLVAPALLCAGLGYVIPNQLGDPDFLAIGRYVRAHTRPGDRILVWGHFPELYWAAGRLPAMRFVHSGFMTGQSGGRPVHPDDTRAANAGTWDDMFEDLAAHPPVYVADLAPGAVRLGDRFPIGRYPRLARWFAAHYDFAAVVDGVWLYRRRD